VSTQLIERRIVLEKVRLGKTGMTVSQIGFGGIPIQRLSEGDAVNVVKRCIELGIDFIDTANAYTTSEERIGKAISNQRKNLIIATKTLARTSEEVRKHLKLSLTRLRTGYIDLYQLHNVSDLSTWERIRKPNGPLKTLEEAKRQGLVRHVGVTSHSLDMARELVKSSLFETVMFPLNFITHEAADELLPLARVNDVGFIAMKPLEGGRIDSISLAFKYLFQFPDLVTIVGIEKVGEIEEIVRILKGPLSITESDKAEIDRQRREMGSLFCRRCDYCQPCTADIPISLVMDYPSLVRRLPPERIYSDSDFLNDAMEKAANCTKCGDCEGRCPYGLPIQEMLEKYVSQHQTGKSTYLKNRIP
jgi:predicted aldo/keto reductase-like oxidoreductase